MISVSEPLSNRERTVIGSLFCLMYSLALSSWRCKGANCLLHGLIRNTISENKLILSLAYKLQSNNKSTKNFLNICENCSIDLNQKILLIVSQKTVPLKLATQNLKNVELILASNLNTFSLLKAKQIILTPLAINDIKEIYCE